MNLRRYGLALAWVASLALAVNLFDSWGWVMLLGSVRGLLWAALPFVGAVVFAVAGGRAGEEARLGWRKFSFAWLLGGEAIWLCIGYAQNSVWIFYGSVGLMIATLIVARFVLPLSGISTQCVNTIILLLVAVPVFDRAFYKKSQAAPPIITTADAPRYYSYAATHGDPKVFAVWWNFWWGEMNHFLGEISEAAPGFRPPIRLRPHATAPLMDCPIAINAEGFRGSEIAPSKRDRYRIVALGESTTFGMTMHRGDKPWPVLLEAMIRDRLKPSRPIEVINAGTPGYDLEDNLRRLVPDILPLRPDFIISYHGYNGFPMLDKSFPHLVGPPPPSFPDRPLQLAAALENRWQLHETLEEQTRLASAFPNDLVPLRTPYAAAYQKLIRFAQTNHIRLALANFCMAIDQGSSSQEISFYGSCGWGEVCVRRRANAIHSQIVQELATANPEVVFINTQPDLNARPEMFVDVVHLTQEGNQRLAENVFRAIRPTLERDLVGLKQVNPESVGQGRKR